MNKHLSKLLNVVKGGVATATLIMPLASVSVVSIVSIVPSVAQAQAGRRLCYIKDNGEYKYFKRHTRTDCKNISVDTTAGPGRKGTNVPKIRGVDMSICENFSVWKWNKTWDICDVMEIEEAYTLREMLALANENREANN